MNHLTFVLYDLNKLVVGGLWAVGAAACGQQGRCPSGCPRSRPQPTHDAPLSSFHVRNTPFLQTHFILEETGSPRHVILEQVEVLRPDLMVIGSIARTGLPGFLMVNTAEAILDEVDCSVTTVKPPGFESPIHL